MHQLSMDAGAARLRTWRPSDLGDLVSRADDRRIWINMTDTFPTPYTTADGREWIDRCRAQRPPRDLVIAVDDRVAGVCGFVPQGGVEAAGGLIGYWLGARHWGKGIATAALGTIVPYVWDTFVVNRLEARVFAWNEASTRVLAKNGFTLEGRRRSAIRKAGRVTDELIYGLLRNEVV